MEYQGRAYKSINSPCRVCEERYPGCHDHCEKYQAASKTWEEFKAHVKAKKQDEFNHYKVALKRAEKKRRIYGK